jgi:hypothetical protein|tara:strand:- start:64 stop:321 length:258 start_codon:yes stop_codon:yes gene_type:complete
MTLRIKGIESIAQLEQLVGKEIGNRIIDRDNEYKGDNYYKRKAYCIEGTFKNGGSWYAGVMIHKGKMLGIKYPTPIKWEEEWNNQ